MNNHPLAEAIDDLIRITLAVNLVGSTPEAIRRLHAAGIKQARIATLLGIELNRVTSTVTKFRKSGEKAKKSEATDHGAR